MGEKLPLANKGKEVTSVGMFVFILALSISYPENSYYKIFFYEQKNMIPIIIPVAHRIYFPVLSDLCRTSKSSFSCCRVDHLG